MKSAMKASSSSYITSTATTLTTTMPATVTLQANKARTPTTEVLLNENEMCQVPLTATRESSNTCTGIFNRQAIRSNYMDKSIEAKKKVTQ